MMIFFCFADNMGLVQIITFLSFIFLISTTVVLAQVDRPKPRPRGMIILFYNKRL